MARKEHPTLAYAPVRDLPKKLRDLYIEEYIKLNPGRTEESDINSILDIDCSHGLSWLASSQEQRFWDNVFAGVWDEEYDTEETLDEKLSNVFSLIKKVVR